MMMAGLPIKLSSIPHFLVGGILVSLGLFTYFKNRKPAVNRWFALLCISVSFWYIGFGIAANTADLQTYFFWQKIAHVGPIFTPPIYLYLTSQLLGLERLRVISSIHGLLAVIVWGVMWTTNLYFTGAIYTYPWGIYPKATPLITVNALVTVLFIFGYCFSCFLRACRRAKQQGLHEDYNRLKYMCVALTFFGLAPIDYLPKYGMNIYPFGYIFTLIFALIVTYAILKYHLLDIDLVVKKGLVYSILVAALSLAYSVSVLLTEKIFQGMIGYQGFIATFLAALVIAVGFIPLKNAVQRWVDRLFFQGTHLELVHQREQLLQELQKTDQLKAVSTFAAGLAHEIKNPLTVIKTFTESLDAHGMDPAFLTKFRKIVGQEVQRVQSIVQQLLEFSKPQPTRMIPLDVSHVLDETIDCLSNECVKRDVEIQRSDVVEETIAADPKGVRQVFLNVLLNSLEAMEQGGTLSVSTERHDAHLAITIQDTGKGIPKEHIEHIFDPFFTTKPTGTGLGLSIVQQIMSDHGGHITIDSALGCGTRCTLMFPLMASYATHSSSEAGV